MFVHEQPLNEHRTVKEVFNSYKARHRTSCTLCKQVEPLVHLKVDVEQSESFIIDDGKLNTSLSAIASKFSRDHEGRNEMVFIVSIFIEGCNIPTISNFHLEFHVLLHVYDPSGVNYQVQKDIMRFNESILDDTSDHKTIALINHCIETAITKTLGSSYEEKFRLPPLEIIPGRDKFQEIPRNSLNEPKLIFQGDVPRTPLQELLPRFIEVLKINAGSHRNVIILLNAVVVKKA